MKGLEAAIGSIRARAYEVPTNPSEVDETFAWEATTIAVVEVEAGGTVGLGYDAERFVIA